TTAKLVGKELNFMYIDTGAMYRAMACMVKNSGVDYFDKNGILCKTVTPADTSYDNDFSSYSVSLEKIRKTSCDIKVALKTKSTSEDVILNMSMTKKNGKWYLNEMVY
ncbi:MAG TPA: (d)CMP kinase, partial [Oscillospiraceae bacterium]|nr:(d)CMP kinase [Oscillospiraceae bacterium]